MARPRGLTIDDVADAAEDLADAEGFDGVTLAGVARRLGIRSPSLYSHVDGLEGVRRLVSVRAAGRIESMLTAVTAGLSGIEALRALAHAYRAFARRHPGLYDAAQKAVRPGEDDALYQALSSAVGPLLVALEEAGAREGDVIHLARGMRSGLHGFVVLEREGGFGMPESVDVSFQRLVDLLLAGVEAACAPRAGEGE